jgi:coenzyme F420-reducing hydrogenase alpha subunit
MKLIKVDALARVEGEGGIHIRIGEAGVEEVKVLIYEPPRYFEALLIGRRAEEAVDITARVCGICPVAYQISAVNAIESLYGIEVNEEVKKLRRLLYLGEWMESHALHIYLLAAPDYLGCHSAFEAVKEHPDLVRRGLMLKRIGNRLIRVIGGREVHPVNIRVGGMYKAPKPSTLKELIPELKKAYEWWMNTVEWVCTLRYPDFESPRLQVSLIQDEGYAITDGDIFTSRGDRFKPERFNEYFEEFQVGYSTALRSRTRKLGESYMVGPLPRVNNGFSKLYREVAEAARARGFRPPVNNPFLSMIARAVEGAYASYEAIRLIECYEGTSKPYLDSYDVKAGRGYGVSEAPRGILYHMYEIDEDGLIRKAVLVPPTSQNQYMMENDLVKLVGRSLGLPMRSIKKSVEMLVRSYDPCISCSTHMIKVRFEKAGEVDRSG